MPGTLIRNSGLKFVCRDVGLKVCQTVESPFISGLNQDQVLKIPVAHNDGNYFLAPDELQKLEHDQQIALRYTKIEGHGPTNPNGSVNNIAGVLSRNGRVLGLMPHPERAISPKHGGCDGAIFLTKTLEALLS